MHASPNREYGGGAVTRRRAFSEVASQLWNSLLSDLRTAPFLEVFQHGLKLFFFRWRFCLDVHCLPLFIPTLSPPSSHITVPILLRGDNINKHGALSTHFSYSVV